VNPALRLQFITMFPKLENYRQIVRQLGPVSARAMLLSMFDIVALKEFLKPTDWVQKIEQSDLFTLSFLRNSEAFFAYKTAGPILRGLQFEELGQLSQTIRADIIRDSEDPVPLTFTFDHHGELPKRIAVIIGKNGVGKSQTLTSLAKAALKGSLTEGDGLNRALISRLLAFAPTNEAESVFPSDRGKRHKIWYRRFSLNRARRSRRGEHISDLVLQVARSPSSIQDKDRWTLFLEAISAIHESNQIVLFSRDGGAIPLRRTLLVGGGEQASLMRLNSIDVVREPARAVGVTTFPLSSGELSFLKFAAQICLNIENGSLVLLDEPETHLHPNFINRFVSLLDTVLELTGSSAIVATHSAYIVKEVFRDQVIVLRFEDGRRSALRPTMQTFGADVGAISYFVFGEDEPTRLAEKLKSQIMNSRLSWESVYGQYKGELSLEFLNLLQLQLAGRDK
jgi:predicted ATPase